MAKCAPGCTCGRHRGRTFTGTYDYFYLHELVRKTRGRACEHLCIACGEQAAHWASVHGKDGTDIWEDYTPMCISCHHAYDETSEKMWDTRRANDTTGVGRKNTPEAIEKMRAAKRLYWQQRREAQG